MFSRIHKLMTGSTNDNSEVSIDSITPSHSSELVALKFIGDVMQGQYQNKILDISADAELALPDRIAAFRDLEKFIKTQDWQLSCTFIDVANSQADAAECYLYGSRNEWLVLYIEYQYNISQWLIGAYEIPSYTFSRPAGESYDEYIVRSITEGKNSRMAYPKVTSNDGQYFISY
jgi:predicted RND superfamily exporter protein